MNGAEFMTELYKILLDATRKQGFSVILLLCGIGYMASLMGGQKAEYAERYNDISARVEILTTSLDDCMRQRMEQTVKIGVMEGQINALLARKR